MKTISKIQFLYKEKEFFFSINTPLTIKLVTKSKGYNKKTDLRFRIKENPNVLEHTVFLTSSTARGNTSYYFKA